MKIRKTNLVFLIKHLEEKGAEVVQTQGSRSQEKGLRTINPIVKLSDEGEISREQLAAAEYYQKQFSLSNLDHYTKSSLVFQGLPRSAASTKSSDHHLKQFQLDASRYVAEARAKIALVSAPHQISGFKQFKGSKSNHRRYSRDLRLIKILQHIFEEECAIRNVETIMGINHRIIKERIKLICAVLLEIFGSQCTEQRKQ